MFNGERDRIDRKAIGFEHSNMPVRLSRAIAVTALGLVSVALASPVGGTAAITDSAPPTTTITFGPEGPTFATRPVFGYESDDPGAQFECSLDTGPFEPCGPATYESLEGKKGQLADGPHTFSVRAVNKTGVTDPTPAVASFIVDTDPPTATILTRPGRFIRNTRPSFKIYLSVARRGISASPSVHGTARCGRRSFLRPLPGFRWSSARSCRRSAVEAGEAAEKAQRLRNR